MKPDGPQTGVAEQDLKAGARGGVALHHRVHIFANTFEHVHESSSDLQAGEAIKEARAGSL